MYEYCTFQVTLSIRFCPKSQSFAIQPYHAVFLVGFIQRYTKEGLEHIQPVICAHCLQITAIWTFLHTCPNVSLSVENVNISTRNQFVSSHLTVVGGVG